MHRPGHEEAVVITLGVSSCLLGEPVRYDGSDRLEPYIRDTLGRVFRLQPCCPEVAIGLGVPRPPIQMVQVGRGLRLRGVEAPQRDVTEPMQAYAREVSSEAEYLSGYIFKSRSPSCGMEGVAVYSEEGGILGSGPGLFARALMQRYPAMPVVDEVGLMQPPQREGFIERVYIYHRWQQCLRTGVNIECLQGFHARHELILQAHSASLFRQLGGLLAEPDGRGAEQVGEEYIGLMMQGLKQPATREGHSQVLQRIFDLFMNSLSSGDREEWKAVMEAYRQGHLTRHIPLGLLRQYLRRWPNEDLNRQHYLIPQSEAERLLSTAGTLPVAYGPGE